MCESRSFIKKEDIGLHGGRRGICAIGGQRDIYLTAPAAVRCRELTMSEVMGINNADAWPNKNSLPPWLFSKPNAALTSPHTQQPNRWVLKDEVSASIRQDIQSSSLIQCLGFNCVSATSPSSRSLASRIQRSELLCRFKALTLWMIHVCRCVGAHCHHNDPLCSRSVMFINCSDSPFMKTPASLILLIGSFSELLWQLSVLRQAIT